MKPEVVWNIGKGLGYSMADLVRAENDRAAMFRRMNLFFNSYDLLLCQPQSSLPIRQPTVM